MQLAAATTTAQKARQKRISAPDRAARHKTLGTGVIGDQTLIPFELRPRDIAFMMAGEQDFPFGSLAPDPLDDTLASIMELTRLPVRPKTYAPP